MLLAREIAALIAAGAVAMCLLLLVVVDWCGARMIDATGDELGRLLRFT